jgi:NADH:ubiquinone oxidoreductase subunit F (NADH-binding)
MIINELCGPMGKEKKGGGVMKRRIIFVFYSVLAILIIILLSSCGSCEGCRKKDPMLEEQMNKLREGGLSHFS